MRGREDNGFGNDIRHYESTVVAISRHAFRLRWDVSSRDTTDLRANSEHAVECVEPVRIASKETSALRTKVDAYSAIGHRQTTYHQLPQSNPNN